ncbi:alanine racemase [Polymorphum gilvum]|nr:alanine racemase [Polymorphum gilvum]
MSSVSPEALAGGVLTVDTAAIADNWRALAGQLGPGARCAATVKADAYGCGIPATVRALAASGCDTFFVALPAEGIAVREAAPGATIYVLDGLFPGTAPAYAEARLRPVLGSLPELEEWALFCRSRKVRLEAAVHVDTGMNRLGLTEQEAERLAGDRDLLDSFALALVISHLACGAEPGHPLNRQQLERFRTLSGHFPDAVRSLANSAGIFLGADYHFDLVRPGIALYGGKALDSFDNPMRPVARVEARILQLRTVRAGEGVGYGLAQTVRRDTRLAVVAAGYADGLLRRAGGSDDRPGGHGWIVGHRVPVFGRISMDMQALDVTDVPAALLRRGAMVELIGPHVAASELAAVADTIDYEYLTALGRRFHRRYAPLAEVAG